MAQFPGDPREPEVRVGAEDVVTPPPEQGSAGGPAGAKGTTEPLEVHPGKLLSRSEAARKFDVSLTTFRRRIEGRLLTPIVAADGAHYFHQEAVEELVVQRRGADVDALETFDGDLAAVVFRQFEDGAHPIDVVLRLKLHPRTVAAIHREWVSLRGGYVVPGEVARQIETLPWMMGSFPIRTGEHLLKNLRVTGPKHPCSDCNDGEPEVCAACARRWTIKEAERRAAAARERAERAQQARDQQSWDRYLQDSLKRKPASGT